MVEYYSRLNRRRAGRNFQYEHVAEVLGVVDDQSGAHGLAALTGSRAARQDRHAQIARNADRRADIPRAPWDKYADRHDLVNRCIRGITAARSVIEQHLAIGF